MALALLALTIRVGAQESNGPALLPVVSDVGTNGISEKRMEQLKFALSTARFASSTHDYVTAEQNFLLVLAEDVPDDMQKTALFELGLAVQAENDLPRAQSIFTQYSQRWTGDVRLIRLRFKNVIRE